MEQKRCSILSILERMEKRWVEEDQRVAKEAPLKEARTASRVVMQTREETPKVHIPFPNPGTVHIDVSRGEKKVTGYDSRPVKRGIEIPLFDGDDAEIWVWNVEQYFELGSFTETQKLQAARNCFDDKALVWYRWERDRNPFLSWEQMKIRVLKEFSLTHGSILGLNPKTRAVNHMNDLAEKVEKGDEHGDLVEKQDSEKITRSQQKLVGNFSATSPRGDHLTAGGAGSSIAKAMRINEGEISTYMNCGEKHKTAPYQKIVEHGLQPKRRELSEKPLSNVLPLSLQMNGCCVIQKAIEVVDRGQKIKRKKLIKAKRKKKKKRTRLKNHERKVSIPNKYDNPQSECSRNRFGNYIHGRVYAKLLESKADMKKLPKWQRRKQKHNNKKKKDVKGTLSVGYDDDGGVKKKLPKVNLMLSSQLPKKKRAKSKRFNYNRGKFRLIMRLMKKKKKRIKQRLLSDIEWVRQKLRSTELVEPNMVEEDSTKVQIWGDVTGDVTAKNSEMKPTEHKKKCSKSWHFKYKHEKAGIDIQHNQVLYSTDLGVCREVLLQKRKEIRSLKSGKFKYDQRITLRDMIKRMKQWEFQASCEQTRHEFINGKLLFQFDMVLEKLIMKQWDLQGVGRSCCKQKMNKVQFISWKELLAGYSNNFSGKTYGGSRVGLVIAKRQNLIQNELSQIERNHNRALAESIRTEKQNSDIIVASPFYLLTK